MTSQLPKPVECIEVEIDDHWCVPPVKVDGESVTKFQYLSLHDINKLFNDESQLNVLFLLFFIRKLSKKLRNLKTLLMKFL